MINSVIVTFKIRFFANVTDIFTFSFIISIFIIDWNKTSFNYYKTDKN